MMKKIATVFLALVAVGIIEAGWAGAETGANPQLDHACTHPAFAAAPPSVTVGARNPKTIANAPVGLRAQQSYCSGPDFKHPADYGTGPDEETTP